MGLLSLKFKRALTTVCTRRITHDWFRTTERKCIQIECIKEHKRSTCDCTCHPTKTTADWRLSSGELESDLITLVTKLWLLKPLDFSHYTLATRLQLLDSGYQKFQLLDIEHQMLLELRKCGDYLRSYLQIQSGKTLD